MSKSKNGRKGEKRPGVAPTPKGAITINLDALRRKFGLDSCEFKLIIYGLNDYFRKINDTSRS